MQQIPPYYTYHINERQSSATFYEKNVNININNTAVAVSPDKETLIIQ